MIIICPTCSTKFMLSSSAIGPEGRDVRCAKCGHQWHAHPTPKESAPLELQKEFAVAQEEETAAASPHEDLDEELLAALTAAATPPSASAASVLAGKGNILWMAGAGVFGLLALVLVLMIARDGLQPALAPVYSALGHYTTEGVVLADVNLRELPSRRKQRYEIECNILNSTKALRQVPQLSMQILNESGEVLAEESSFLENTGQPIPAGKSVPCRGLRFENMFSTSHLVVMDMGSPLELSLRSSWDYPEEENEAEIESESTSESEEKSDHE